MHETVLISREEKADIVFGDRDAPSTKERKHHGNALLRQTKMATDVGISEMKAEGMMKVTFCRHEPFH